MWHWECKHDVIDNGTRISECRKCKKRMEFIDFEWVVREKSENFYTESYWVDTAHPGYYKSDD